MDSYFKLCRCILYNSLKPEEVTVQLASQAAGMGVCAKTLKAGDVAWKCEDCEKDPTCIICQECFEKGDHKGHRTWLKTNVSGCCDCGDPDGWAEEGFCTDHKGFAASSESMLKSLPAELKTRAVQVFNQVARDLKLNLLAVKRAPTSEDLKAIFEQILDFLTACCCELPSNIYFVGRALQEVFAADFTRQEDHICNYRYFISAAHQKMFAQECALNENPCSCSVLDLIFQTNTLYSMPIQKKSHDLMIQLFQTYEFKQTLAMAYVANLQGINKIDIEGRGLIGLGVQVLTIEPIAI